LQLSRILEVTDMSIAYRNVNGAIVPVDTSGEPTTADFQPGDRVKASSGCRYGAGTGMGTVLSVGRSKVRVELDYNGVAYAIAPHLLERQAA
jgi:hypothetical protein